jgi:hypothetical protein
MRRRRGRRNTSPPKPDRAEQSGTENTASNVSGSLVQAGSIDQVNIHHSTRDEVVWPLMFGGVPDKADCFQQRADPRIADTAKDATATRSDLDHQGTRVLFGLGGVGKTQLAAGYARSLLDAHKLDLLVWVIAQSRETILSAYARLAATILGVERGDAEQGDAEQGSQRLLAWLASTNKRWLVVLDDVQAPGDLRGLWPPNTDSGQVVITTRHISAALTGDRCQPVKVDVFTRQDSMAFLKEKLAALDHQPQDIETLAETLGHLPLALAQAATYIVDRWPMTCAGYCVQFASRRKVLTDLFPDLGELPDGHQQTVATTWSLSIEHADQLAPRGLARPVLEFAAQLDPNGIPLSLFTTSAALGHFSVATGREVMAEDARDAVSCLRRLNLLSHNGDTEQSVVSVHALVQRATREEHEARDRQAAAVMRSAAAAAVQQAWDAAPKLEHWSLLSMAVKIAARGEDEQLTRQVFGRLLAMLDRKSTDSEKALAWAATYVITENFGRLFPLILECLAGEHTPTPEATTPPVGRSRLGPEAHVTQQAASSLAYAFEALANWEELDPDRAAIPILREGLTTWSHRKRFVEALTRYIDPDALDTLRVFAQDLLELGAEADAEVLDIVATAIANLEVVLSTRNLDSSVALLERIARQREEPWIRRAAIEGMNLLTGRNDPVPTIGEAEFITRLASYDWKVIENYCGHASDLMRTGHRSVALLEALLKAFSHQDPVARRCVAECLGLAADQRARDALEARSEQDPAVDVRQACLQALQAGRG